MTDHKRFILWGSAGHAKVLSQLVELNGGRVEALFDNNPKAESAIEGVPCYIGQDGFERWVRAQQGTSCIHGIAAIGGSRGMVRLAIHDLFKLHGIIIGTLVHPDASMCKSATLGTGTQVLAKAVVSSNTRIGDGCIINHGAIADHECIIGDGVHLAPGAVLCGCITIGNNVFIGAGAVVLPRLNIGSNTVVGAGAVVTRSLPDGVVAVGNPARIVKNRE